MLNVLTKYKPFETHRIFEDEVVSHFESCCLINKNIIEITDD